MRNRRNRAKDFLGGSCIDCGEVDKEQIQFDHIDASTKMFDITANLNRKWEDLYPELLKCVLRCGPCHLRKSQENGDFGSVPHGGGLSGKKNCQCAPCRERKQAYMKVYNKERRRRPRSSAD